MSENLPSTINTVEEDGLGTVSYANDVIAIIAGLAATEVEGVAGMSGGISDGIADILGRKNLTRGVKVEVGNEEAAVDLVMVLNYGVRINEVCVEVQESVKKAIESMTGLHVVEVNIHVMGIKFDKPAPPPPTPKEAPETTSRVK